MRKKQNNNLIAVRYDNGRTDYYTSLNRIAIKLALAPASIKWAIEHNNVLTDVEGKILTVGIVDGSEVPYKLINN